MLPQGIDNETFEKVVKYLNNHYNKEDYKQSRVLREKLFLDLFSIDKESPDYEKVRHQVELVARASKTDIGMVEFERVTGVKGFIQATVVNKKSYYETVRSDKVVKYNPRNEQDVRKLIEVVAPVIKERPTSSAEEIASRICRSHGYVIGSILPTVGTVRAKYNGIVTEINEKVADTLQKNKGMIFRADKDAFLREMENVFDSTSVAVQHECLVQLVLEKLQRK